MITQDRSIGQLILSFMNEKSLGICGYFVRETAGYIIPTDMPHT